MACDPNELLAASSAFAGLTADQHDAIQTELLCRIYEGGGGGGISGFTPGSVIFAGATGEAAEDNANLFFDDTNKTMGIGTTRTGAISGTNPRLRIKGSGATSATSSFEVQSSTAIGLLFVRNDGRTGFGTTVPASLLDARLSGTNTGVIQTFGNITGGAYGTIGISSLTGVPLQIFAGLGGDLALGANNAEVFRIKSAGFVGLGTLDPLSIMHVSGANQATNGAFNTYGNLFVSSSDAFAIDKGGAISLGGLADGTNIYTFARIQGKKETAGSGNALGYLAFETDDNNNLVERMRITSTGNVGIGTRGPLSKLTVLDTVSTSPRGILSMQISSDTSGARVGFSKSRGAFGAETTIVTGDTLGRLLFRGYDGTNYLEMASVEVVSVGTIAATRVPTYMAFSTATDATPSVLTERMRISSAGLVSVLGSLTVGGSAAINTISKVLQGSATLDPGSVAAGANATSTITVTGAAVSDPVILGLPNSWGGVNMFFTAWVSAANTVSIKYHNVNVATAIDLASELVKVFVIQQ